MYEFSVSFAWGVLGAYLFFERKYHLRDLGLIALPIALALLLLRDDDPGDRSSRSSRPSRTTSC